MHYLSFFLLFQNFEKGSSLTDFIKITNLFLCFLFI